MQAETEVKDRVEENTASTVNETIQKHIDEHIRYYADHRDRIDDRLKQLEREWDIERWLEANAATLSMLGVVMSLLGGRKWLLLNALIAGFLFQHSMQGWCPPVSVFRSLRVRTKKEILYEWYALRALRGDFDGLAGLQDRPPCERVNDILRIMG